jgi:chromosome partitioning protein
MRTIAIANQKGGVGKTTTVASLAGTLASRARRVVVIDLDPQSHLTASLGLDPRESAYTSYDVLTNDLPLDDALHHVRDHLWLIPANLNLAAAEQELVSVVGRETILRDALEAAGQHWDYVLIDCPPSLGMLTLNALCTARELFIPVQPHFLSLQGLSQLLESILLVQRRINPALQVTGLLFCMYDARTSLSGEIVGDIENFFQGQRDHPSPWQNIHIFATRIRGNIKLAECPSHGRTINEYAPLCNGAVDYAALADEVEAMHARRGEPAAAPVHHAPAESQVYAADADAAVPDTQPLAADPPAAPDDASQNAQPDSNWQ